jgi:NAD(P)-dependent dehydrogenase (short-subunit alcohol dehydrogenase family)
MRNTMGTEQKVAVITGASQGFGAGLVKAYRDRNYRVIANSRSIKPSKDSDVLTIAGDVADPKTADRIVQEGLARFGRIDTLINNAGIFIAKPLVDYTEEDYASVLATNLGGFFRVTKRVAAEMLKQGSGHIVQITTSLIDHANSNVPSVLASVTKGGLNAATKSLAIEYAKKGVRVNAVAPGVMKTPMHAPETHEFLAKMHPVGRMGEIQDIVDAIMFLENAPFVTGENRGPLLLPPARFGSIRSSYDPTRPECPSAYPEDRLPRTSCRRLALGVSADSGLSIEPVLHQRAFGLKYRAPLPWAETPSVRWRRPLVASRFR